MDISKLKPDNAKAIVIIVVSVAILVFGLYYVSKTFGSIGNLFSKVGQGLGVTQSPAAVDAQAYLKTQDNTASTAGTFWSPSFYENAPGGTTLLTQASADAVAAQIWDSVGIFSNDPAEMVGAFTGLQTQAQVSYVADRFNQNYSKDLYTWLRLQFGSGTQIESLQQAVQYVNSLPAYN